MQWFTHFKKTTALAAGLLVAASTLTLTACDQPKGHAPYWEMPAKNKLSPKEQKEVLVELRKAGVQVIQQGHVLQMVLPTDLFFEPQSTEVQEDYVYTLHEVALYLHTYVSQFSPQPVVRVSGYTDTVFSHKSRKALSNQYAQSVASYLWNDGFTSQQLVIAGYGALHPIANNETAQGSAYNRRVMIQVN